MTLSPIPSRIGPTLNRSRSRAPEIDTGSPRTAHVGDDHVERRRVVRGAARAGVEPHHRGQRRRRRELHPVDEHVGAERLVDQLGLAGDAGDRRAAARCGSSRSVASVVKMLETRLPPRRGPAPGTSVATGTPATSDRDGSSPRESEVATQGTADDGEHDVVHGHAVRALHLLDPGDGQGGRGEVAARGRAHR